MALNTVSSDRLSTNVKNTNFTAAEKQDLTDDILPLAGQIGNRNMVHNGEFVVSQRDFSSSAVTQTGEAFTIDRWKTRMSANSCLLYTSPSPRDLAVSRMPSSA